MKVLMIGPSRSANGGISAVVNEYYKAGLDDKCELEYYASTATGNIFVKIDYFTKAILHMKKAISRNDVIHIHMSKNGSFFRKYFFAKEAKKQNKKIVIHIHSSQFLQFYRSSNLKIKKMIHKTFDNADKVFVLSEYWKEMFKELINENKMVVLANGIVCQEHLNKRYDNQNILFLGKICELKGIFDLLKAISITVNKHKNVHLYIGGVGEIDTCKNICRKFNIEKNVSFCGWVSGEKKDKLLKNCSIFVLPSYTEGMPVSLIEAMSYGCSCIVTDVGAIPEIHNESNSIMVKPGDVEELSNSICMLLEDNKVKENIGEAAFGYVSERYDENKIVEQLCQIYASLGGVENGENT